MSAPEQGWYADPSQPGQLRWWDGVGWTTATRVLPQPVTAAPAASPTAAPSEEEVSHPPPTEANPEPSMAELLAAPPPLIYSGTDDLPPPFLGIEPEIAPTLEATTRDRRTLAIVVGSVVVLAGLFAIFVPSRGNIFALTRGHCLAAPPSSAADGEASASLADLPVVGCTEPHDAEVFAVHEVAGTRHPGGVALAEAADAGCHDRFEDEVGLPELLLGLRVTAIWPSPESWSAGDREVLCLLAPSREAAVLTGSALGLPSLPALAVGDCLEARARSDREADPTARPSPVACDEPHHAEVFAVLPQPEGPWPGVAALLGRGTRSCRAAFQAQVGELWKDSALDFVVWPPSLGRWSDGDRDLACLLVDPSGATLVGTHRAGTT